MIKFKLKVYPIIEDDEIIYRGGFFDVIRIDFNEGWVECYTEYSNSMIATIDYIFSRRQLDRWYYCDNRDERSKKSELYYTINNKDWIKYV